MTTKESGPLRGARLIKKAIESGTASGILASPEPVAASLVRKLKLPNGEPLSPAMKELLAFDGGWLALEYDEDEAEVEAMSLEEVVEELFGEEAAGAFGEAYEVLAEDCVLFGAETDKAACLYVGTADEAGEYPVLVLTWEEEVARVAGFVPFDVWVAQELGALERGKGLGEVPEAYRPLAQALADANGDGRLVFIPEASDDSPDEEGDDDEGDGAEDDDERPS